MAEAVREAAVIYSVYLDQEEFEGILLALQLMLGEELTHDRWREILDPVLETLEDVYVDEFDL